MSTTLIGRLRPTLAAFGTAIAAITLSLTSAATANADPASIEDNDIEYCANIASSDYDHTGHSIILGSACSTTSMDHAYDQAADQIIGHETHRASNILVSLYQYPGYTGAITAYFGWEGTCDSAGYRFDLTSDPDRYSKSSAIGYENCTAIAVNNDRGSSAAFRIPVSNFDSFNNDIARFRIYQG